MNKPTTNQIKPFSTVKIKDNCPYKGVKKGLIGYIFHSGDTSDLFIPREGCYNICFDYQLTSQPPCCIEPEYFEVLSEDFEEFARYSLSERIKAKHIGCLDLQRIAELLWRDYEGYDTLTGIDERLLTLREQLGEKYAYPMPEVYDEQVTWWNIMRKIKLINAERNREKQS